MSDKKRKRKGRRKEERKEGGRERGREVKKEGGMRNRWKAGKKYLAHRKFL